MSHVPHQPQSVDRKSQRVTHATLFYKTKASPDQWTALQRSFHRGLGQENVTDVIFDGGIQIHQKSDDESSEKTKSWKIRFDGGKYDMMHVDEFTRPNLNHLTYITVQFRTLGPPKGEDAPIQVAQHVKKSQRAPKGDQQTITGTEVAPRVSPYTAEQLFDTPNSARLPLARLSRNFKEDGYTELLLVFTRNDKKTASKSRHWSWPATLAFLDGQLKWTTPKEKTLTDHLESLSLVAYAGKLATRNEPWVLRSVNRGYRLMKRSDTTPPLPVGDLPAEALSIRDPSIAKAELGKRKRDELEADITSLLSLQADLPRQIEKKRQMLADLDNEDAPQTNDHEEGGDTETADVTREEKKTQSDHEEEGGVALENPVLPADS